MAALEECDVVMKGGVTSGVVYLGAVAELGRTHRLRCIGGASAGAIAASYAAAAEYRRQRTGADGLAGTLAHVREQLTTEGFQERIFQPARPMRPVLDLLLALVDRSRPQGRRGLTALGVVIRSRWWVTAGAAVALAALLWLVWAVWEVSTAPALLLTLLLAAAALLAAVGLSAGLLALSVRRFLDDPANGFGICPGMPQGTGHPAVTDVIHGNVQAAAGTDEPLAFRDLDDAGITLRMLCTDLSRGMPVTLPLDDDHGYRFRTADLAELFPEPVLAHLVRHGGPPDEDGLRLLPAADLPIVVAARMSLGFPLLISAIRLYGPDGRVHWMSDGGIASNFPIHFFDAWLPVRPTFGLDLWTDAGPPPERWAEVPSSAAFLRRVFDSLMNWRDSAQTDLPGYADRIARIPLGPGEGELNLRMPAASIEALAERGAGATAALVSGFRWEAHLETRRRLLVGLVRRNVDDVTSKYGAGEARALLRQADAPPDEPPAALRITPRF